MAKDNIESTPKPTTKKHEARVQKEQRQRKFLTIGIIAVVLIVVALVVYGVLDSTVLKQGKAVAKVDSTTISVEQFQKRVQYERLAQIDYFTMYASSPYAMFFQSSLISMQDSLDNYVQFGSDILDQMIDEAVIAEKAKELGITVTDEEINKELESAFGFYPNGTPTASPTTEYRPTSTMSATQLALITITPTATLEPTATEIPATPTESATSAATEVTGTEAAETEIPATATATAMPTETAPTGIPTATAIPPTATPYTQAGFDAAYQNMITQINENFVYTDADFRAYVKAHLLQQKVSDYVNKDVSRDQDMVWARHILVGSEDEAKKVLEELKNGEDFGVLAQKYSSDTASATNGGDLGWFFKGQMVEDFEKSAFSLKIGEISEPVKTEVGYHIIQVLGHEVRQLTDDQYDTLKKINYSKFLEDAKAGMKVTKKNIWASVVPSTPAIPDQYRINTSATEVPAATEAPAVTEAAATAEPTK